MLGGNGFYDVRVGHVVVGFRSARHAQAHQPIFREDNHARIVAFVKRSFESTDNALEYRALILGGPDGRVDLLAEVKDGSVKIELNLLLLAGLRAMAEQ